MIEDDDLLEKCNTAWDKVRADIKKEFDSKPVYNKTFLKTKIKSHGDEVADFDDKNSEGRLRSYWFFSNYIGFFCQEKWQLLSASVFKRV